MTYGGRRPPHDEEKALFNATLARQGVTTAPGAGAGNSIIDAGLIGVGANSFISMLMVVYPGQPRLVDSMDITGFNNATGEVTLAGAYKGVAAPIPAGVPYKIVTFRFVPAEVAALTAALAAHEAAQAISRAALGTHDTDIKALLGTIADYIDTEVAAILADVGDASGATLGSILGILGDPAQSFLTMIGYEGATSLANKLTAARAGYLDNIDTKAMGRSQIAATTIDLNQAAGSYDLFTGTTQAVILESLNIKLPTGVPGGTLTGISIQTDDATPGEIISVANGDVANLLTETDLGWTGTLYITVGTKIQLTIAGGPAGASYVCNVTAKCRAVVSGGYLN